MRPLVRRLLLQQVMQQGTILLLQAYWRLLLLLLLQRYWGRRVVQLRHVRVVLCVAVVTVTVRQLVPSVNALPPETASGVGWSVG